MTHPRTPEALTEYDEAEPQRWSDADRETANRWLLWAGILVLGFAIATGGIAAIAGGIWQ